MIDTTFKTGKYTRSNKKNKYDIISNLYLQYLHYIKIDTQNNTPHFSLIERKILPCFLLCVQVCSFTKK